MATSLGGNPRPPVPVEDTNGSNGHKDPFALETPTAKPQSHRYSSFDTQLFALNHSSSSPAQAKKALEAHLVETDRRIQETSKLGTTLVKQRQNLSQRLRDVGSQEEDSQITPELRQKLTDIEREYNEVGRQSARAFLGPRSVSTSGGEGTPFALDGRVRPDPSVGEVMLIRGSRTLRALLNSLVKLQIRRQKSMCLAKSGTEYREQMTLSSQLRLPLRF